MAPAAVTYGFVAWIATHVCLVLFLLWAFIPERVLHDYGVTYYPSKHWALALPSHAVVSVVAAYVLYWAYNMMRLPPLEDLSTIVDEFSKLPDEREWAWGEEAIPTVVDLPITYASKLIFTEDAEGRARTPALVAANPPATDSLWDQQRHRPDSPPAGAGATAAGDVPWASGPQS
jgi:phosphatidylinositol glycan class P protein